MKTKTGLFFPMMAILMTLFMPLSGPSLFAQKKSPVIRIGTYDSRVVVFAWSRSDDFRKYLTKDDHKFDSAQKAHDTALIRELASGKIALQHLLHQMVFSNGSAGWIMEQVKTKLPDLAKAAGVVAIVSKWEVSFIDPAVEIVDLTDKVAKLFEPKESIEKMAAEIAAQPPVPMDELGIEVELLDLFCQRYGNK